ncbi:hypothetical protein EHM76_04310 [bacterium]|nr:MAG: hypothetical protein EHM76_04310 [bacterium]
MSDHERIWLQNAIDAGHQEEGRLWCQDKVWPDDPEDGEPTEYVRADLYAAALAEIERLQSIVLNAKKLYQAAENLARNEVHTHTLPDGTVTAVAAGPPHPVKDHGYE